MPDRTEEALSALREAEGIFRAFAEGTAVHEFSDPRALNRAKVARAEAFSALLAVVDAAVRLGEFGWLECMTNATDCDCSACAVSAALTALATAVLGEEASDAR